MSFNPDLRSPMFIIRWIFRSIVLTVLTKYAARGLPVLLGFLRTLRR
jgi:hypothetical protein